MNAINVSKNTALHIASKYSHFEECVLLLKAGANITARNSDGMTPIDVAGDARIKALLLEKSSGEGQKEDGIYPPLPTNVKTSSPSSSPSKADSEKTTARRSSMKMIKVASRNYLSGQIVTRSELICCLVYLLRVSLFAHSFFLFFHSLKSTTCFFCTFSSHILQNVFKVGGSKDKQKEKDKDDELAVDDMHNLYGASDR